MPRSSLIYPGLTCGGFHKTIKQLLDGLFLFLNLVLSLLNLVPAVEPGGFRLLTSYDPSSAAFCLIHLLQVGPIVRRLRDAKPGAPPVQKQPHRAELPREGVQAVPQVVQVAR